MDEREEFRDWGIERGPVHYIHPRHEKKTRGPWGLQRSDL